MIVYPNAKINLGLSIVNKRPDGFHSIETVMYPIPLFDKITLIPIENYTGAEKLVFSSSGLTIDGELENNLIVKAFKLINDDLNIAPTQIHLEKNIPFGAGLGGGSADCAFTINALNQLYDLKLTNKQMEYYAAQLGSDCPFFIKNKPALAKGRGEMLSEISVNLKGWHLALVIPPVGINTKQAYSLVEPKTPKKPVEETIKQHIEQWKHNLENDFEISVYKQLPEIEQVKTTLYELGAAYASLSGSGSASFGIFNTVLNIKAYFPENYFVWTSQL
ncbi:MAG: 4-(cytidine 5'-diphospho)-2-C-methyl-D-erythritol kinase [Bacteroidetes bacterium HGW-Bacteroidetes-4]|nr:MAG: 4-(cytidine 5'-diphospho)-2-C-methyl-D-erythritol kinase [Bacteroidetes bacterium HGW-Bacteroidetes-4]